MNNQYLIEVVQSQVLLAEVDADNNNLAIERVNNQCGVVTAANPLKIETLKTKLLKVCDK